MPLRRPFVPPMPSPVPRSWRACSRSAPRSRATSRPSHDFHDTTYEDMLRSAIAVGPELARAGERGVGDTVLAVVQASRRAAPAQHEPRDRAAARAAGEGGARRRAAARAARRRRCARSTSPTRAPRTRRSASPAPAAWTSASSTTCAPSRRWACARPWRAPPGATRSPSEYVSDFALTFETGIPALVARAGRRARGARGDRRAAPAAARGRAGHADRAQARRRGGGAGVGGRRATCSAPEACAPRPGGGRCGASTHRCASRATR